MASIPVNQFVSAAESNWTWRLIEVGERIFAGILLVALSPVLCAVWVAVALSSGLPPLIAHRRAGRNHSELWVLKFRSMWNQRERLTLKDLFSIEHIDDQAGPELKGPDDPRVGNCFARFCRRHSIDELPQLWHVLRGEMSLVGPRPVTPAELNRIYGSHAAEVLQRKPGISGLWQVSGRNRLSVEQRCRLDLECVRRRSFRFYFEVLMRTIPEVLSGTSTW